MLIAVSFTEVRPLNFVIAITIAALLATAIFAHANKRGNRHATAWGVATFLFAGIVVPLYFIVYWLSKGRTRS